ncbi:hypothetical protein FPV67DRAFT_988803 [Lyophyllum atratum]|nr:hypothetical protein FPV67DRAFT_988803 [Lyophyllum atratum]
MIASFVPQEIINAIIESLPTPLWSSTLRTCSLVSSSFRDPAQRQLFKVIHVSLLPPLRSRNTTLCGTLIDNPRLCSFVKALHIFIGSESFDVDTTSSTLTRLRRLNHLSLTARDAGAKWESLPKSFQRDVCEILLVTTTLRSLTLRNIMGFPTHAICQCPQLLALHVWSAWFYRVPGQPCDGSETQGYLQKLRLGGDATIGPLQCSLLGGSSPLSIARLRRLNAEIWSDMSFTELIKLLELSGSYMEDLELTIFAGT